NAVEVFLARDTLGATPAQYGLGELAAGAGSVLGAAVAGRLSGGRAWVRGTIGGFAVGCGALAVAGAAPSFWVYLVLMVVVAGAAGVGNAANGALVITRTPDAQRGTVGAALSGIARTGSVLALALGGLLGTLLSPRAVFVGGGVLGLVVVLALGWRAVTAAGAEERAGGAAGAPATAPAPTATGTATVAADLPARPARHPGRRQRRLPRLPGSRRPRRHRRRDARRRPTRHRDDAELQPAAARHGPQPVLAGPQRAARLGPRRADGARRRLLERLRDHGRQRRDARPVHAVRLAAAAGVPAVAGPRPHRPPGGRRDPRRPEPRGDPDLGLAVLGLRRPDLHDPAVPRAAHVVGADPAVGPHGADGAQPRAAELRGA